MKFIVTNNEATKTVHARTYRAALAAAFDVSATQTPLVLSAPGQKVFGSVQIITGEKPANFTVTKL
jgi:hypothetical protein